MLASYDHHRITIDLFQISTIVCNSCSNCDFVDAIFMWILTALISGLIRVSIGFSCEYFVLLLSLSPFGEGKGVLKRGLSVVSSKSTVVTG